MIIDSIAVKQKILSKFLELASFDGWNEETLKKSIRVCGIDDKFHSLIFENGCLDLIEFYIEQQNLRSKDLANEIYDLKNLKIRDKIKNFLYLRFEVEIKNKIALRRLVNFYIDPANFISVKYGPKPMMNVLKNCYKIADFMWYSIDDNSTDFNFYTKRLTLAKIILRSFAVFLKDDSEDLEKTKKFIDVQIENVMKFEKHKAKVKNIVKNSKTVFEKVILNEDGSLRSRKDILKSLPFIRLIK